MGHKYVLGKLVYWLKLHVALYWAHLKHCQCLVLNLSISDELYENLQICFHI